MEVSPIKLFFLLVSSFILGVSGGVFNDLGRTVRYLLGFDVKRNEKKAERYLKPILEFLFDIVLFIYLGCGTAVLLFYFNDGAFRAFSVLWTVFGFLLYRVTLGRLVMKITDRLARLLRRIIFLILRPPMLLMKAIFRVGRKITVKIFSPIAKRIKLCYNKKSGNEPFVGSEKEV